MGSCGKTIQCDCIAEDPDIYMKIVSEKDSSDLVFGETSIYSPQQILAYTVKSKFTVNHSIKTLNLVGGGTDSVLVLENPDFMLSTVILDYGNQDVDTLTISFETLEFECCGEFRRINSVLHNGIESYGGFITTLKK